jgi:hypothetical protein
MIFWPPNATGQTGVYKDGSPNYIDVDSGVFSPQSEAQLFATKATADGWSDGDTLAVFVKKDNTNWAIWMATWDAANEYLLVDTVEDSLGSFTTDDPVTVYATISQEFWRRTVRQATPKVTSATSYTALLEDSGSQIVFTSGSPIAVSTDQDLPVGYHVVLFAAGAGVVTVSIGGAGGDTLNGATAGIPLAGQWKSAYLWQYEEGAWMIVT